MRFSGRLSDNNTVETLNVMVFQFQEGENYILYSPALDLSGYGKTEQEATESFEEAFTEFMRYSHNKNTTRSVLVNLGWKINKYTKKRKKFIAPSLPELLERDSYLGEIFTEKDFRKFTKDMPIPAIV